MFEELKKIKYYVILCILSVTAFTWAGIKGYKLTGDDNETKEQAVGNQSTHSFYHK